MVKFSFVNVAIVKNYLPLKQDAKRRRRQGRQALRTKVLKATKQRGACEQCTC